MTTKHIEKKLMKTKKNKKKEKKKSNLKIKKNSFDKDYLKQFDIIDKRTKEIDKELNRIKL